MLDSPTRFSLPLSLSALFALISTGECTAQSRFGVRAAVGHADPSLLGNEIVATSERFNVADGVWNNGEGFMHLDRSPPVDTGGYFKFDDGRQLIESDIHPNPNGGGWMMHPYDEPIAGPTNVTLHRFVGFLYPALTPPPNTDGFTAKTAFEVFIPNSFTTKATVLVIMNSATISSGDGSGPGNYPGNAASEFAPGFEFNAGL